MRRFQQRADLEPKINRPYNGKGEAEVVFGAQLSVIIRKWIVAWMRERPSGASPTGQMTSHENTFMGPVDWLAEKTGINYRRISGIANGEYETVSLSHADSILTAIGHNLDYLVNTGEIQVWPNPNWSPERWAAYMQERLCCE